MHCLYIPITFYIYICIFKQFNRLRCGTVLGFLFTFLLLLFNLRLIGLTQSQESLLGTFRVKELYFVSFFSIYGTKIFTFIIPVFVLFYFILYLHTKSLYINCFYIYTLFLCIFKQFNRLRCGKV